MQAESNDYSRFAPALAVFHWLVAMLCAYLVATILVTGMPIVPGAAVHAVLPVPPVAMLVAQVVASVATSVGAALSSHTAVWVVLSGAIFTVVVLSVVADAAMSLGPRGALASAICVFVLIPCATFTALLAARHLWSRDG